MSIRLRCLAAILGAAFACAVVDVASAAEPSRLDSVLETGALRVGTTGDYKPFSYLNPQTQQFEGMDIDLAQALGKALGVKVEFVQTSWSNLIPDLQADKFDIAVGGVSVTL